MEIEFVVDDGRTRTGNVWSATAHAITAIVGTGVLALPWSVAQLGWIVGPIALILFALVTYYMGILLSNCYRSPDPIKGQRNYTYMDAVRACLGEKDVMICGIVQYLILWGTMVGYTITAPMCMMAIKLSNCFHIKGRDAPCEVSGLLYAVIYAVLEIILSQLPNLENISSLSYIAAAMSFVYSMVGLCLCILELISHPQVKGTLIGAKLGSGSVSLSAGIWRSFQALGNIAFAYTYAMVLIEIQDTLKSPPPENKTMKKANTLGIGTTTVFYFFLGSAGYAAFGSDAPGNILTGFYEPFWLIDIGNVAVLVHLVGAYQLFSQPLFAFFENWLATRWPDLGFFSRVYTIRSFKFTLCKLILRTLLVVFTSAAAVMFPFFNAILGLLGSLGFWPLTVYYPVTMYSAQAKIKKGDAKWVALQALNLICLLISVVAIIGSVADISGHIASVKHFKIGV